MPFRPVQSEKLASAVVRQIEELILRGILRPGERLPAERELRVPWWRVLTGFGKYMHMHSDTCALHVTNVTEA